MMSHKLKIKINVAMNYFLFVPFVRIRPHPHEPKTITFWDKLAHFSGKISTEKLAKFAFSFRTALKMEINSRLNLKEGRNLYFLPF